MPVLVLVGPRQAGKTTLVRARYAHLPYRNLEDPDVRAGALRDPRGFLAGCSQGALIDEVQRFPELLSYLQGIVDADPRLGRWVLTGSQHLLLMSSLTQSLAGRCTVLSLLPFTIAEAATLGPLVDVDAMLHRGWYPRIHVTGVDPTLYHRSYYQTFVERDLRALLQVHDLAAFDTFVRLCAGRVGQLLNVASLANDAGIAPTTARAWLSLLETAFVIVRLPPWHANIGKRLTKSPKLYFIDVGLAAYLLGIEERRQLPTHPLRGQLFENLVVMEAWKHRLNRGREPRLHFFRTAAGDEVDLLYPIGSEVVPIEIKSSSTVQASFFSGLRRWRQVSGSSRSGAVVHGGMERPLAHAEGGDQAMPVAELSGFLSAIDAG